MGAIVVFVSKSNIAIIMIINSYTLFDENNTSGQVFVITQLTQKQFISGYNYVQA